MPSSGIKFGDFELDPGRYELRRAGRSVKLEKIPMELLILLVGSDGDLVSRQEIVQHLWAENVFVDTDLGINTAIRKIRRALGDDPEKPRFVQTVTGKGYRFVAEKNGHAALAVGVPAVLQAVPQPMGGQPPRKPALSQVEGSGGVGVASHSPVIPATAPKPASARNKRMIAALVLSLAAAATFAFEFRARLFPRNQAAQIHSIAVIPLANLSGDSSQEYFADGMTDELITALAKNRNLRVVSRTSAMQYKGAKRPIRDIAHELGVDGILEGSIERTPNTVHMTVQLIYAPADTHVWAESYDRDLNQAYSLAEELSETIAKEVKTATSPASPQRYINPEAHDAYLRGRFFWFTFNTKQTLSYFEKAIQLQPDYAAAWSGLADAYAIRAVDNECPAKDVVSKMELAARRAVELDDSLPEAHNSLAGWYFFFVWDLPHADAESKRTVDLDPKFAEGHHLRSYILEAMNRPSEALEEQKRSIELDSFSRPWALGKVYLNLRQFDLAIQELRLRAQSLPNDTVTHALLAEALWLKGESKESVLEMEKSFQTAGTKAKAEAVEQAFERGGTKAVAQILVADMKDSARERYVSPLDFARQYAYLGDKDQTLKFLEQAYGERTPWLIMIQNEPIFDLVHFDPRYQVLVRKIGLPAK
jgi:TolB-like protein/DNA-binding winged helix-turn-helix (wHTH) protein